MSNSLPVISCDGCGVCCLTMGHPQYFWQPEQPGHPDPHWETVPSELQRELLEYIRKMDNDDMGNPCIWFDQETRKCRHHEIRPQLCRDFEMGGTDCRRLRLDHGIV